MRSPVQVTHITLHGERRHMENFHYKTANKEGIQYYTLNFLWHFTHSILAGPGLYFRTLKLLWNGSCLPPVQRPRVASVLLLTQCGPAKKKDMGESLYLSHSISVFQSDLLFSSSLTLLRHEILGK